jgi:two-component system OmpR family response regulator
MDVLIVDDSAELLDLVERALLREGHEVRVATTLAAARRAIGERKPELLVLDLELPDGTGIYLCRALRQDGLSFPILLLTAHGEVPQRVAGLDAGADDFLAKPFAVAELRARIRALGRRGPIERPASVTLGDAKLDLSTRTATRDARELPLTAREWEVLELLINRRGRVVSRSTILELVWGEVTDKASSSLDVIMARIRRKLGSEAIRTLRGEGYVADVG